MDMDRPFPTDVEARTIRDLGLARDKAKAAAIERDLARMQERPRI
jgi:hypothetical protein